MEGAAEFKGHRDHVNALTFTRDNRLLSGGLDTTVLAWNLRPGPANKPFPAAWNALAEPDATAAFQAQGTFLAEPAKAIAWIAERIKPAVIPDPKRLPKLMADLDSPEFTVRDQATKELRELGDRAAEVLREAAEKSESLEVRRRARTLLAELDTKLPA